MRYRLAMLMLGAAVAGCAVSKTDDKHYSVYFLPYSQELDQEAQATVHTAAAVAVANPALPVALAGYAAPPDPGRDIDGLSAQRAAAVRKELIGDGVTPDRITLLANGTTDPNGLPNLSVRRVDISIGR